MLSFEEFSQESKLKEILKDKPATHHLVLMLESFDSPQKVEYYYPYKTNDQLTERGKFFIDNHEFDLIFHIDFRDENEVDLDVNFVRLINNMETYETLNDLNKKQVLSLFSTVMKETERILKKYNVITIHMTTEDAKKLNVYRTLLKRFIKGYNELKDEGIRPDTIILMKSDTPKEEIQNFLSKFKSKLNK